MATEIAPAEIRAHQQLLWVPRAPEPHPGYQLGKRVMDVVLAGAVLIALSPVMLVVALLVKATSPGPVLFRQERCGLRGMPFGMLKFRTMVVDAEARLDEVTEAARQGALSTVDAPAFKSVDDPRVTFIGKYLRRFSVDELPQLLNVVRGDMSLVGPRPLVFAEAQLLPEGPRIRHAVPPGITCIWQTSGRSRLSYDTRMAMDIEYVERRSLRLDAWLLLKTPLAVLSGDGAC